MALRMTVTHDVPLMGEQQFSAYIRVQMISGSKSHMTADVRFMKDIPDGETIKTTSVNFTPDLIGDNFFRQAYIVLKGMPAFSGAEDC